MVGRLEAEGRMLPAGRAEIERAQADGRWAKAYGSAASRHDLPEDLAAALAAEPAALAMFEILTSANRFAVIHRVTTVKRAETRAKKIAQFVEQLSRGETIYPQKRTL
ncbi:YdeI/OmpD-associated family protein [Kribbella sp. NPDC051952]|uniref:YdeI/OmpD-associated family protein n=1 Tax=Kribbella sp. NPDC051952 TaxID=3154851 RepID=UPI00343E26CB